MSDENRPSHVHREPPADELTAAAYLWPVLSPVTVELGGRAAESVPELARAAELPSAAELPNAAELPKASRAEYPDPTASAEMEIKSVPVTLRAKGSFPASDAPAVFATLSMTAVGVTGIMSALMTAYVAAEHAPASLMPWFVGLAAAQLAVAASVIFRIGRRSHRSGG